MSHITKLGIKITVDDLPILRSTAERLGFLVVDGPTEFSWHSGKEKCDMRIDVPGVSHQVGVVQGKDYNYQLQFDSYGGLGTKIGQRGEILMQEFAADKVEHHAMMNGWGVDRRKEKGEIHLTLHR